MDDKETFDLDILFKDDKPLELSLLEEDDLIDLHNRISNLIIDKNLLDKYIIKKNKIKDIIDSTLSFINNIPQIYELYDKTQIENKIKEYNNIHKYYLDLLEKYEKIIKIINIKLTINKKINNEKYSCIVCCETDNTFVRLNCGHILCDICGDRCFTCPQCSRNIYETHIIFF